MTENTGNPGLIYEISIEGQTIPMPAEIAMDDKMLKDALAPFWPGAANSKIMRSDAVNGKVTVTVIKQAGTKGNDGDLHVFSDDVESFVAHDLEGAKKFRDEFYMSPEDALENGELHQVPDDQDLIIFFEDVEDVKHEYLPENRKVDGNHVTAKAADWAKVNGIGFLCGEDY
jgi:hypothetical protein